MRNVQSAVHRLNHHHHIGVGHGDCTWSPSIWIKSLLFFSMASSILLSSSPAVIAEAAADSIENLQWQTLTRSNFSSQIRLHHHLILIVTMPWYGESRSLMKELGHIVSVEQGKFGTLKLMVLYKNDERILAESIGATEQITILFYHHSVSLKYQGRLRAQHILSAFSFLTSFSSKKIPLEYLETPKDFDKFLQSTDKAIILLEFCGWTRSLLAKGWEKDGSIGVGSTGETNSSVAVEENKNQVERMTCGVQTAANLIPWHEEYTPVTGSDFLQGINTTTVHEISCSFDEFQRYESFFSKFMTAVREFFLPPEKLRFGLVSERSLFSSLGVADSGSWLSNLDVEDSDSWFGVLYTAGCPSCSKVLREGDDFRSAVEIQNSPVVELGGGENDAEHALPANKPSLLLFIDRSSDSSETRRKSKEAMDAFRKLALPYQRLDVSEDQNNMKNDKLFTNQASKNTPRHTNSKTSSTSQSVLLKDKMSITLANEGEHVSLDKIASELEGKSLAEILTYILQQKKEVKLSSLAKEVGFQLLSDDFDVKIQEALPAKTEAIKSVHPLMKPVVDILGANVDLDKGQIPYKAMTSTVEEDVQYDPTNADESLPHTAEEHYVDANTMTSGEPNQFYRDEIIPVAEDADLKGSTVSKAAGVGAEKLPFKGFTGSFFFYDGEYQLLKALTLGSKIPSAVIVDPVSQKHYVMPEETGVNYSSLVDFLERFLNGSLIPHQKSGYVVPSPREAPSPPFINLDFHEVDAIPRVTTQSFTELVIGFHRSDISDTSNAWNKDVLVLFSNSWCGFCQRIELVVREVYRAFKRCAAISRDASSNKKSVETDDFEDTALELPLIYFMDCTLNDCSLILTSNSQKELYPLLLLFPAERKDAVPYDGDIAVSDIIKFVLNHGHNVHDLVNKEGILWAGAESRKKSTGRDLLQDSFQEKAPLSRDIFKEVPSSKYKMPERVIRPKPLISDGLHQTAPQVVLGSILVATEKLANAHPFSGSTILIVKADRVTGFEGLIINKPISWDSLDKVEGELEIIREGRLSFGGPLLKHGTPLVALSRRTIKKQYPEVLPNVYFLDQLATIDEIRGLKSANHSATSYWFFLGYSGWGWDQLYEEISQGAWEIDHGSVKQLDWPWR